MRKRYKACTHCTLTCHANISEVQKDDRKKAKQREKEKKKEEKTISHLHAIKNKNTKQIQ